MTAIQPKPQPMSALEDEIERSLQAALARPAAAPTRPPASSDGPPPPEMWGPTSQRATSPMMLLAQVAENTEKLQEQMEALCREVTGAEAPPKRLQPMPVRASGLLPAISQLATNIEQAHVELERLILHVRRRL